MTKPKGSSELRQIAKQIQQAYTTEYKFNDSPLDIQKRADTLAEKLLAAYVNQLLKAKLSELLEKKETYVDTVWNEKAAAHLYKPVEAVPVSEIEKMLEDLR